MTDRLPLVALLATALILVAVLLPGPALPELPEAWANADKLAHFLMFAAWAWALHLDFGLLGQRRSLAAFAAFAAFCVGTEVLQLFAEGRSFDLRDMAADAVGFAVAFLVRGPVCRPFLRLARRRSPLRAAK